MRVLVAWADPRSPNMGVRVLAQGLREAMPPTWDMDFVSHRAPLITGPLLARRSLAAVAWPTAGRRELGGYDLVLDVGEGDSFASIYGLRRLLRIGSLKWAARRAGVPVILAPQTLGPWDGPVGRAIARTSLRAADCVWARDSASARRAGALGHIEAHLSTDLVFALKRPAHHSPLSKQPVALNVSGLLWGANRHVDHNLYRELVYALLDHWQRMSIPVRLIAHVVAPGHADDDVACSRQLSERYDNATAVVPANLDEVRGAIADCQLLVGARMHACLNALSLDVPTVPLAYSDKFKALFADLGYPEGVDLRRLSPGSVDVNSVLSVLPSREQTRTARRAGARRVEEFAKAVASRYA